MKKAGIFLLIIIITPGIAGLYGAIHDQVTYSISNEYYTKFKYQQFQVFPEAYGSDRMAVAIIGVRAGGLVSILESALAWQHSLSGILT